MKFNAVVGLGVQDDAAIDSIAAKCVEGWSGFAWGISDSRLEAMAIEPESFLLDIETLASLAPSPTLQGGASALFLTPASSSEEE